MAEPHLPSGACRGLCKGDRAANEGPARWASIGSGKKMLMCPCCSRALRHVPVDFTTGAPNVIPGLVRKEDRFTDDVCWYDVVVLRDLK